MENVSTYAKSLIESLLNVHALSCMNRSSNNIEYMQEAGRWLPTIKNQLASLERELNNTLNEDKNEAIS